MSDLIKELEAVINKHNVENESDTPDFLLASLVSETLKTWAKIVKARDDWYGFKPWGASEATDVEASTVTGEHEASQRASQQRG